MITDKCKKQEYRDLYGWYIKQDKQTFNDE